MLSCAIYAREQRDVSTVNMPGNFIQVDIERDIVNMKLEVTISDLFTKLDP